MQPVYIKLGRGCSCGGPSVRKKAVLSWAGEMPTSAQCDIERDTKR